MTAARRLVRMADELAGDDVAVARGRTRAPRTSRTGMIACPIHLGCGVRLDVLPPRPRAHLAGGHRRPRRSLERFLPDGSAPASTSATCSATSARTPCPSPEGARGSSASTSRSPRSTRPRRSPRSSARGRVGGHRRARRPCGGVRAAWRGPRTSTSSTRASAPSGGSNDLDRWAAQIEALLRPGGIFYIRDGHPAMYSVDERRRGTRHARTGTSATAPRRAGTSTARTSAREDRRTRATTASRTRSRRSSRRSSARDSNSCGSTRARRCRGDSRTSWTSARTATSSCPGAARPRAADLHGRGAQARPEARSELPEPTDSIG